VIILPRQARDKHRQNSNIYRNCSASWQEQHDVATAATNALAVPSASAAAAELHRAIINATEAARPRPMMPPAGYLLRSAHWFKNGCNFGYRCPLENHKNGFKATRHSEFRPFLLESSRVYPAA
jgi:hypothetical protein